MIGGAYQPGLYANTTANPNVTWETATIKNIGFEFSLFNGLFSGEADYFTKRTVDILLPNDEDKPESLGTALPDANFGVTNNKGFEFVLNHKNNIGDFGYNISVNGTYAKSKIIEIKEPIGENPLVRKTGAPINQHQGWIALGLFQSVEEIAVSPTQFGVPLQPGDIKYKDLNEDGVIDGNDKSNIGNTDIPEFIYGFNIGTNYKNFELNLFFQGATGFDRNVVNVPFELDTNSERVLLDSWSPTNTDAAYPRLSRGTTTNNHKDSTFWLKDATYLRLKNIELAYTIPQLLGLQQIGVDDVRLFLSGSNLLTWSKIENRDPEGPSGIRGAFYPQTKSILLGINVKF